MTAGFPPTNSAASVGSGPARPSAQRYSIATFWPSMYPISFRPVRNAVAKGAHVAGDEPLRNPTTGLGCCARATSGHAEVVATPVINSRRLILPPETSGATLALCDA